MKNAFVNYYVGGGWFSLFGQDSFRVSNSLSLQLGLRWEYRKQPHDKYDKIATIFPLSNSFASGDALLATALPDAENDARLTKRFSQGLSVLAAYTYSKQMDFNGGDSSEITLLQDANNPMARYSVGDIDMPQVLSISPIWELPFGSGRRYINRRGFANALAGGWEFTGIVTFHGGNPYTIYSPDDYSNSGSASPQPDRVCNGSGPKKVEEWFDTSCFTTAYLALALANGTPRFGNSGRNILFGPSLKQWDISFIKHNQISERFPLEFRAEFFNLFNHPNFGNPASTADTGDFGLIEGAGSPRDIQFGLKLNF